MAKRNLKEEELALWQYYTESHAVAPLKGEKKNPTASRELPKFTKEQKIQQQEIKKVVMKAQPSFIEQMGRQNDIDILAVKQILQKNLKKKGGARSHTHYVGRRSPGIDNTQWKKLVNGQTRIDGKLDLHGYTIQEAFEEFCHFMQRAGQLNWRCVEIITGLGSGTYGGMIRQEFPHWLQRKNIKEMILSVVHSHAGNHGAVRILLKRKKHF